MRWILPLCAVFALPPAARCQVPGAVPTPVIERGSVVWEQAAGERIRIRGVGAQQGSLDGRLVGYRGDTVFIEVSEEGGPLAVGLEATTRVDYWRAGDARGIGAILGAAVLGTLGAYLTPLAERPEPDVYYRKCGWGDSVYCEPGWRARPLPPPSVNPKIGGFLVGAAVGVYIGWNMGKGKVRRSWRPIDHLHPMVTGGPRGGVGLGFSIPN